MNDGDEGGKERDIKTLWRRPKDGDVIRMGRSEFSVFGAFWRLGNG